MRSNTSGPKFPKETCPLSLATTFRADDSPEGRKSDGRKREGTSERALLESTWAVVSKRGPGIRAFVIVDVDAKFSDVGPIFEALTKDGIDLERIQLFVADFKGGSMNELHWDLKSVRIPGR